jgi:hypothetical protein
MILKIDGKKITLFVSEGTSNYLDMSPFDIILHWVILWIKHYI